jgi:uncharacterized phage-associated protein
MDHPKPHDPRALANAILAKAATRGLSLTLMQILKLVYLSHGWSLAMLNRPLSKVPAQAWQYGPVHPQVYSAFKQFGSGPITGPARSRQTGEVYAEELAQDESELIDAVLDTYGHFHAFQLSNMMHKPGTPWAHIFAGGSGAYNDIPDELIKNHYDGLPTRARGSSILTQLLPLRMPERLRKMSLIWAILPSALKT